MRTSEAGRSLCDCGCGGELSEAKIALGWRFLKGHKPRIEGKIKTRFAPRILPSSGVEATSLPGIKRFAEMQLALLNAAKAKQMARVAEAQSCLACMQPKIAAWENILLNAEELEVRSCADVDGGPKVSLS